MSNQNIFNAFKEMWINVGEKEGWRVIEDDNCIVLKSTSCIDKLNLCLPKKIFDAKNICEKYFINSAHGVIHQEESIGSYFSKNKLTGPIIEMRRPVPEDLLIEKNDMVFHVKTNEELIEWCEVAGTIYGFDSAEMFKFMKEILPQSQAKLFYVKQHGKIVSIGQIYVDSTKLVYIATIGTLEEFRNRGYGTQIMNECLLQGKQMGGSMYALYSSKMGEGLYKKLLFEKVNIWQYSIF